MSSRVSGEEQFFMFLRVFGELAGPGDGKTRFHRRHRWHTGYEKWIKQLFLQRCLQKQEVGRETGKGFAVL